MLRSCRGTAIAHSWRQRLHRCVCSSSINQISIDHKSNIANKLLSGRQWLLRDPSAPIKEITTAEGHYFKVLRDDLLHPFISGNKARKLDAYFPELIAQGVKDVVTCGGSQSAHILAVAAAAAEHGMRAHLLVRGERPTVPTGLHLYARMLAHSVVYVKRAEYAHRTEILSQYAKALKEWDNAARVAVIPEGGSDSAAMLGLLRLVAWLSSSGSINTNEPCTLVVDSGTGTTATGLALAAALLELPWKVVGVILAGPLEYYQQQTNELVRAFCAKEGIIDIDAVTGAVGERLEWLPRKKPRKFGNIFPEEVQICSDIASEHGVVLDPIWTLAAWEAAVEESSKGQGQVLMLHTGGALGLCGLAQRYPDEF